ncbi:MAG TPA: MFS transporter [Jatrophihabitans sp.]|nr:MFS transporter [Jatrophihabitans sp.]
MGIDAYRQVLSQHAVRRVLALGLVVRIPLWAANVVLVLQVVSHLDRSYGAAGLVSSVATIALAVSGPWRGRRLDRVGLRRAVAPSLFVLAGCWSVAPFLGYWPLLLLAGIAGLFTVPSFSIVRQAIIHAVDEDHRKTALSIDAVVLEISFMIGPALGVLLATVWPTQWALFVCEFASIAGGVALWIGNPTLRAERADTAPASGERRPALITPAVLAILAAGAAATLVLTGTDVGVVAALRDMHHQSWIGWELAVWGLGSAVGGLIYGALHRTVPAALLLALLAGTTMPAVVAREPIVLAVLLFVAGLCCAPTLTATVDALSRAVPEQVRGEAFGWHGSALTAGSAVGAPVAGVAIDHVGWHGGFLLPGALSLATALVLVAVTIRQRMPEAEAPALV